MMMSRIKHFLGSIFGVWYVKYLVVVVLGVLYVGFLDENSVWAHLKNRQQIGQLEEEIELYQQRYQRDQAQLLQMQRDPKAVEKIARERYFMKADDEDIFVLSDDERQTETATDVAHETAE